MGMAFDPSRVPPGPRIEWRLMPKFRRWFLNDDETLVKVRSWRPSIGKYGLEWPTMLVDRKGYERSCVCAVWNWARIVAPFRNVYYTWQ